jgi:hypothetical protein
MAVMRVHKTKDYTVMSNTHFREREMSLKAKGLLSLMFSLPDTWDYSIAGLVAICKENETAITSTLKELKKFGYLSVTKLMPNQTESGRIEYVYDIYETPTNIENLPKEKQGVENQGVVFQAVEKQGQLNTNKSITKELSIKELNTNDKRTRFVKPSLEEIKAYCIERNNNVDAEHFYDYYEANGWKVGKNSMKDWKASVRTWERNGYDSKPKKADKPDESKWCKPKDEEILQYPF